MVTYEKLSHPPQAAPSLIGMTLEAFDWLFAEFAVAHTQRLTNLTVMNRFQVLRQVYRHRRSEHSRVVRIVASLVNRRIAGRPLKVYAAGGA